MIISKDTGKAFDKNPTPFHNKNKQQIKTRRKLHSIYLKAICVKLTASIILNGEKLNVFL